MRQINPLLVKELQGRMRGGRSFLLLSIYLAILGLFSILIYWLSVDSFGSYGNSQDIGKALFFSIGAIALVEVSLIAPALTANSINGEKERQSFDLLVSSLLTPWQIIQGKLFSALSFAGILLIIILPFLSFSFLFGGVSLAELIIAVLGMFCSMLLFASLGIFTSTIFRSSTGSLIVALGFLIFYMLLIPFLLMLISAFGIDIDSKTGAWLFVYITGFFIALHPFVSLAYSEFMYQSSNSLWYDSITINQNQVVVPSPWIATVILSILISILLCYLSVKRIRNERNLAGT